LNLAGPVQLLKAEAAIFVRKSKVAEIAFENAVSICRSGEFHQFAGLASERYAIYLIESGDSFGAKVQMSHAIEYYGQWGATRKVQLLQDWLKTSIVRNNNSSSTDSLDDKYNKAVATGRMACATETRNCVPTSWKAG